MLYRGIILRLKKHHGLTKLYEESDPYLEAGVTEVTPVFAILSVGMVIALCFCFIEHEARHKKKVLNQIQMLGY